jgi:hypothetical protein
MRLIKKAISKQWRMIYEPLKQGKQTAAHLNRRMRSVFKQMRSNRDPNADDAPDMNDFYAVLAHWQIAPDQVDKVVQGLRLRARLFGAMGVVGVVNLANGIYSGKPLMLISGIALIALGIVAWTTSAFRVNVLTTKTFKPFKQWLLERIKR